MFKFIYIHTHTYIKININRFQIYNTRARVCLSVIFTLSQTSFALSLPPFHTQPSTLSLHPSLSPSRRPLVSECAATCWTESGAGAGCSTGCCVETRCAPSLSETSLPRPPPAPRSDGWNCAPVAWKREAKGQRNLGSKELTDIATCTGIGICFSKLSIQFLIKCKNSISSII